MNDTGRPEEADDARPRNAGEVMTTNVIAVGSDEPVRNIARLLLQNRISAVPVVDSDGVPIGMVSEGDLIGRGEKDRLARSDWWLALITGQQKLDDTFQSRLEATDRTARDVMAAPLVTVTEETDLGEIARLLAIHHIKRLPVLRDGRIVGIVSRADLLRALASASPHSATPDKERHRSFLVNLFGEFHRPALQIMPVATAIEPKPQPDETKLAANDFRGLVEDFHQGEMQHRDEAHRAAAETRRRKAKELVDEHVFDPCWRGMLHQARIAAENGQKECLLLRFPNQLCIDGGRAINVAEHGWPATLRGEPAEIYLRWEQDLKPRGFLLSARVLEFPDGKPGDIGLFLGWAGDAGSSAAPSST